MASGIIKNPHIELLTLTDKSSKIGSESFTVLREGNKLYIRGWFQATANLNSGETIYRLPAGVLPLGSFVMAASAGGGSWFLVSFQATGEITVNGAVTAGYWNLISSVVVLQ